MGEFLDNEITRRNALATLGLLAGAVAVGPLIAGCGGSESLPEQGPTTTFPRPSPDLRPAPGQRIGLALSTSLFGETTANGTFTPFDQAGVDRLVGTASNSGASIIRVDFDLNFATHQQPPGEFDWSWTDRVMRAATAHKLGVMATFSFVPPADRQLEYISEYNAHPRSPNLMAKFGEQAMRRYQSFDIPVFLAEAWNEWNLARGGSDPEGYVKFYKALADAIKGVDDRVPVAIGGLGQPPTGSNLLTPPQFLDAVLPYLKPDAAALHPYRYLGTPNQNSVYNQFSLIQGAAGVHGVQTMLDVLKKHNRTDLPLWLNEMGAPTGGPGVKATLNNPTPSEWNWDTSYVDTKLQAKVIGQALLYPLPDVNVTNRLVYTGWDTPGTSIQNNFGILYENLEPKPSARVFREIASQQQYA